MLAPGVFNVAQERKIRDLFRRLVNQNEQSIGLFYLHPDEGAGVSVSCVALLRRSLSFHITAYDRLVTARCGRLRGEFQAKLGWLVGNLYSRVATPDWDSERAETEIDKLLAGEKERPLWVSEKGFNKARVENPDLLGLPEDELASLVARHSPPPLKEQVVDLVTGLLKSVLPALREDRAEREKVRNHLMGSLDLENVLQKAKTESD